MAGTQGERGLVTCSVIECPLLCGGPQVKGEKGKSREPVPDTPAPG